MIMRLFFLIVTLLMFPGCNALGAYDAKITIRVVDEAGNPIEGAMAGGGFWVPGPEKIRNVEGFTDLNGVFSAKSESIIGEVGYGASKEGYYKSGGKYFFKLSEAKLGRLQPWNPQVTLVLRKIENPVEMYARKAHIKIPVIGKEVGFDLIEYDWVEPYGTGKHADFTFKLDKRFVSVDDYDSTLTLSFPNKFDGIIPVKEDMEYGSDFKLPRFAPENGYQKKVTKFSKRIPGKPTKDDFNDDNGYIFRILSEEKDGKLERAMYGKIMASFGNGDIRFYPGGKDPASVSFTYYLNPDYTKNLEFDPKKNLFGGGPDGTLEGNISRSIEKWRSGQRP